VAGASTAAAASSRIFELNSVPLARPDGRRLPGLQGDPLWAENLTTLARTNVFSAMFEAKL